MNIGHVDHIRDSFSIVIFLIILSTYLKDPLRRLSDLSFQRKRICDNLVNDARPENARWKNKHVKDPFCANRKLSSGSREGQ